LRTRIPLTIGLVLLENWTNQYPWTNPTCVRFVAVRYSSQYALLGISAQVAADSHGNYRLFENRCCTILDW